MNQIPSVDLRDFLSDNEQTKSMFVQTIGKAFQEIGFCAVRGHFLDDDLVNRLYSQIKLFFDLPTDIKRKYEHPEFSGQRGYVSFGKESAKGSKHGDLKEYWHFGQYISEEEISRYNYFPNIIVDELPEFNKVGEEVYKTLEKTAKYVLRALALYLDIDENYFDNHIKNGNSILRPIHYPPINEDPKESEKVTNDGRCQHERGRNMKKTTDVPMRVGQPPNEQDVRNQVQVRQEDRHKHAESDIDVSA